VGAANIGICALYTNISLITSAQIDLNIGPCISTNAGINKSTSLLQPKTSIVLGVELMWALVRRSFNINTDTGVNIGEGIKGIMKWALIWL